MKYWQEYNLAKHKRQHFGRINIGDSDKKLFIIAIYLNLQFRVILMCTCSISGIIDMEAKAPL